MGLLSSGASTGKSWATGKKKSGKKKSGKKKRSR